MQQVLAAISAEPIKLDQLVQRLPLSTGEILSTLMQLELTGGDHPITGECNTSVALNPNHVILIT